MWIVVLWGRRKRELELGYVADFCPVCRGVQSFVIQEIRMVNHIWFTPIEHGTRLGEIQTCLKCGLRSDCHLARFLRVSLVGGKSIEELITTTFPALSQVYSERLALEDRIAKGDDGIDEATRKKLMFEVFDLAEPHFEGGYGHEGRRILARALKPLRPTEGEIRACLQSYRDRRSRIGSVRTADVIRSIRSESGEARLGDFDY